MIDFIVAQKKYQLFCCFDYFLIPYNIKMLNLVEIHLMRVIYYKHG